MIKAMNNKYPSFASGPIPEPEYDCTELKTSNYTLRARCNKNNPDCQRIIEDEKKSADIKIVDLDASTNEDNKNMIDVWIKKHL